MIDGLKPYPKMKNSGVPWLGEVPEHWAVRKVREVARVINGFPFDAGRFSQSTGYPLIRIRDLNRARTATRYDGPFVESARVNPGDVLVGMDGDFNVGTWRGAEPALLNQRMCCIRSADPATERLLAYLLPQPLKQINEVTWSTTVKHLASGQVERIQLCLPPLPEQAAIVRFLDHADRRIRRYVRAKQKLIKLLEELKAAIIHRAVTRGLDPNVRLKPSGVEWLGDVPEHWEVVPLRWYISIGSGDFVATDLVSSEASDQKPVPVIGGNGITGYGSNSNCNGATIVIGRVGALCGNVHLVIGRAWVTDNAQMVTRFSGFEPDYLALQLRTSNLNRLANANAQPLITGQTVKEQRVVKPPRNDQQRIASHVNNATAEVDAAIDSASREIALLHEYRTRLIADVVTGKLDVRETAARLPDEEDLCDFAASREPDLDESLDADDADLTDDEHAAPPPAGDAGDD